MPAPLPIAVLVSGSGTNLQALIDATQRPGYAAEIVVVISDRPGVRALERATSAGISCEVVPWQAIGDSDQATLQLCETAERHGAQALVLAGFLRILAAAAIERFNGQIVNIHPSLLPAFPATIHAVRQALEHGAKVTGVTVHFVTEEVDAGPIIAQEAVSIRIDDDEHSLHARIQEVEHRLYPEVVDALGRDRLELRGRTVVWKEAS